MRQAIITKYSGPSSRHGARVWARCSTKTVSVDWDNALSREDNHDRAAVKLVKAMEWNFVMLLSGSMPDSSGYAYVLVPK